MTIEDILRVLPRKTRRQVERILCKPGDVSAAAKKLRPLFQQHSEALQAIGLVPEYAAYALPFYAWNPGGDLNDYVTAQQTEAQRLADEVARLEREIQGLQQILKADPGQN